jgi:ribosomal-protein-alanine N-acetyltransferase
MNADSQIIWMVRRDMDAVLAIEAESFEHPWSERDFIDCLRRRLCIGMVARLGDRVVGFMIYELSKERIDVLNFAVAADCRRRGVGRRMVEHLAAKLSPQRRRWVTVSVGESNLAAQLFFRDCGFRAVLPILKGRYRSGDFVEDAYRFELAVDRQPCCECENDSHSKGTCDVGAW